MEPVDTPTSVASEKRNIEPVDWLPADLFSSPTKLREGLAKGGYLADDRIASTVFLSAQLGKPVLVEGPAGVGKTELAKATARLIERRLIRLQCYEGLDESKALYEWNYKKQLLRIEVAKLDRAASGEEDEGGAVGSSSWHELEEDIFSEGFLLERPLMAAIRALEPVVLLIDEIDRVELETEALLLEVLSDYQISVPELGTIRANTVPLVFLTSNNSRELSEALKRRCLYLHIDYPDQEREEQIIAVNVPGISERLSKQIAKVISMLRSMDLKKAPSVSETIDWARTLVLLAIESVNAEVTMNSLHVLLKYRSDIDKVAKRLHSDSSFVA